MSSPDQTAKDKVIISLFLDGMGPTEMFQQLTKDGVKISRKDMKNIVHNYMASLPESIDDVDCSNMNSEQISNLKVAIQEKFGIDKKIHKFETMKKEVGKLRLSMGRLYPELELITNSIKFALDAGVPRFLIKKRFKNINKISTNFWAEEVNRLKSRPPGVH